MRLRPPSPRRDAALVLTGVGLTDLAYRVAQVALPLLVLAGTGSAAATGLVAGATGVPVLLSAWWARRLRHHLVDGRRIALCYLGEGAGLATVATWASRHAGAWWPLVLGGLVLGAAQALSGPARDALLADLGDGLPGPDGAVALLTVRELARRVGMVVGPALGGVGVATGHGVVLLWVEVSAVALSAALVVRVRGVAPGPVDDPSAARAWPLLRERPDVLAGWVVRGSGCLLWFAFTLGLSLLGVERGRPGAFLAIGMAAYGAGSVAGTLVTVPVLRRVPALPAVATAWGLTGLAWAAMGLVASSPAATLVVAGAAAVSGVTIALGNAGVTAQVVRGSDGPARRTLLAGQSVLVQATSSLGLLVGGSVLARLGAPRTLTAAGTVLVAVAAATPLLAAASRARSRGSAHSRQRQNGWPAGSRRTRKVLPGWCSARVAPRASVASCAASRSSTVTSRCTCCGCSCPGHDGAR